MHSKQICIMAEHYLPEHEYLVSVILYLNTDIMMITLGQIKSYNNNRMITITGFLIL